MKKITTEDAVIHMTYMIIPKVYRKTETDNRVLDMAVRALDVYKEGHWIEKYNADTDSKEYKCDCCGRVSVIDFDFCPWCAADMKGARNGTTADNKRDGIKADADSAQTDNK